MAYNNNDNETLMTLFDEEGNTLFEDEVGSYERAVRGGSYKVSKQYINPTQENSMNQKSVRVQDISDIGFRLVLDK